MHASPETDDALAPWPAFLLMLAIASIPLLAAARPVTDADVWWHLKVGEWVTEHGTVPSHDPFSTYGQSRPWVAYSWLFEVVLYGAYHVLGLTGILLLRMALSLAVVAGLFYFVSRREPRFLLALGLTALALLAINPLLSERPWLFTILFTTLTLNVVLDARAGKSTVLFWCLPLIFVLWANLHIQFVYGFLILGLGCGVPILDRLLGRATSGQADTLGTSAWWKLVGLAFACGVATLLNPYHVQLYGVVLEYATQPVPFRLVNELVAPNFRDNWSWIVLALALGTTFALGRRTQVDTLEVLFFLGAAILAFRAKRDAWMLVLAALVILPPALPSVPLLALRRPRRLPRLSLAVALTVVIVLLVQGRGLTEERLLAEERKVLPREAVAIIRERGFAGPIYNHFNWGGYLIWRLPEHPVSMDGRTNLHGEERILQSWRTWAADASWKNDVELTQAGMVLAGVDQPLTSLLRLDARFEAVYEDQLAIVFVRRAVVARAHGGS